MSETEEFTHLAPNFRDWACGHPYAENGTQEPTKVTCPDCLPMLR